MAQANERARLSGRSAVSNGTRLFLQKRGIDYRTLTVRRFKDLIRAYSEEYEVVSEADTSLIRMAAGLTLKSEQLQAAMVRGEHVKEDDLIRLTGTTHRVLSTLKRRANASAPPAPLSFAEQLAQHHDDEHAEGNDD